MSTTLDSSGAASELAEARRAASLMSGGSSEAHIHDRALEVMASRGLSGDVLDFGAGRGDFTRRLAELPGLRSVTGADLMARPADLPAEIGWIEADLNDPLPAARQWDVVTSLEVIEHLENPRAAARSWHRLVRPGGAVLCSTPNNESLRAIVALVMRGHFVAFGDSCYPAHITALVARDVVRILREAGFQEPDILYTDQGSIPGAPALRWQQLAGRLLGGRRFSDNLLAVARKP